MADLTPLVSALSLGEHQGDRKSDGEHAFDQGFEDGVDTVRDVFDIADL